MYQQTNKNKQKQTKTNIMKTLNTTNGATQYFTKSFNTTTKNGNSVEVVITRRTINVTETPYNTPYNYDVKFKGEIVNSYNLNNKEEIEYFMNFVDKYSDTWGEPSFFELTFGMALQYFKDECADIVILETGMGGRLDSTNSIPTAEICAITNIGLDHTQFLGEDISSIAIEKAGIIKNEVPVVLGKMRPEAQSEILKASLRKSSEVHYGRVVSESLKALVDSPFEFENIATAVKIIDVLSTKGWLITKKSERAGFQNYKKLTGQLGRWQTIPQAENLSEILIDCAHNVDGMRVLMDYFSQQHPGAQLHIVFGTVADKNPCIVLKLIPENSVMYWCSANVVRSMNTDYLQDYGLESGLSGEVYRSVNEAVTAARSAVNSLNLELDQHAKSIVCGSVYVVGEVVELAKF